MSDNTENKAKILAEKTLFSSKYFSIQQRQIQRDGKTRTKDFFVRRPVVMILPYTQEGEIYVELQYRDAFHKPIYEIVAGHVEGDDILEAAKRELQEETGLVAHSWQELGTWELSSNMNAPIHVFAATDLVEGVSAQDEDEEISTIKLPLSEVLEKVEKGEFIVASHIAAIILFDKLRREGKLS